MSDYYFTKDELYHHGVKGQKWGQRNYQNEDGSLTAAGRVHYGYGEAQARYDSARSAYKSATGEQIKRNLLYGLAGHATKKGREADQAYKQARADYKQSKKDLHKAKYAPAVEKYQKKFEEANASSERVNALDAQRKATYKSTGKNGLSRVVNNIQYDRGKLSGDKAKNVKAYRDTLAKYDKAVESSQKSWEEVGSLYKATGSNYIARVSNNIKYDTILQNQKKNK